jgi:hypothetical protein
MKTLWCKNQENPSDRISHAWAPLIGSKELVVEIIWYLRFILGIEKLVLGLRNQHGD